MRQARFEARKLIVAGWSIRSIHRRGDFFVARADTNSYFLGLEEHKITWFSSLANVSEDAAPLHCHTKVFAVWTECRTSVHSLTN
jgi:hypothetical protein